MTCQVSVWTGEGVGGFWNGGQLVRSFRRYVSDHAAPEGQLHVAEFAKYENAMADAIFCANAHDDLPRLLRDAQRLRRVLNMVFESPIPSEWYKLAAMVYTDTAYLFAEPEP